MEKITPTTTMAMETAFSMWTSKASGTFVAATMVHVPRSYKSGVVRQLKAWGFISKECTSCAGTPIYKVEYQALEQAFSRIQEELVH